jgi:hypothetical protein
MFLKMSAFNTRTVKNSNMFVRTHVAFYFGSLLLSDILQGEYLFVRSLTVYVPCTSTRFMGHELDTAAATEQLLWAYPSRMPLLTCRHLFAAISSIINSAWVREGAVEYGPLCTAQGRCGGLFT